MSKRRFGKLSYTELREKMNAARAQMKCAREAFEAERRHYNALCDEWDQRAGNVGSWDRELHKAVMK